MLALLTASWTWGLSEILSALNRTTSLKIKQPFPSTAHVLLQYIDESYTVSLLLSDCIYHVKRGKLVKAPHQYHTQTHTLTSSHFASLSFTVFFSFCLKVFRLILSNEYTAHGLFTDLCLLGAGGLVVRLSRVERVEREALEHGFSLSDCTLDLVCSLLHLRLVKFMVLKLLQVLVYCPRAFEESFWLLLCFCLAMMPATAYSELFTQ